MSPTRRLALMLCGALVVGGLSVAAYRLAVVTLGSQRQACSAGPVPVSQVWCSVLVRYPNRVPAVAALLVVLVLAVLAALAGRWCLQPFRQLVATIDQMGPTNLGHRFGLGDRPDALGRLATSIDAMLDRTAAGYDSQRRFAANASHELRTPLAVQRTLIEVGMTDSLTDDQLHLLADQLLAVNRRNERLIEGLLTLAEAEQAPVGHTLQRLDAIAADVVRAYRSRAQEADVDLRLVDAPATVRGERVLLERLLTNLVQNAIAYNVPGGTVEVAVGPGSMTVSNTGPVVREEELGSLFEPFRRGAGERLSHPGGAGLGLTIVRAVTVAHGATIDARPGPDGGLVVRVDVPPAARS